jgi:hypothetical protein
MYDPGCLPKGSLIPRQRAFRFLIALSHVAITTAEELQCLLAVVICTERMVRLRKMVAGQATQPTVSIATTLIIVSRPLPQSGKHPNVPQQIENLALWSLFNLAIDGRVSSIAVLVPNTWWPCPVSALRPVVSDVVRYLPPQRLGSDGDRCALWVLCNFLPCRMVSACGEREPCV